jgi:hypothetical protein
MATVDNGSIDNGLSLRRISLCLTCSCFINISNTDHLQGARDGTQTTSVQSSWHASHGRSRSRSWYFRWYIGWNGASVVRPMRFLRPEQEVRSERPHPLPPLRPKPVTDAIGHDDRWRRKWIYFFQDTSLEVGYTAARTTSPITPCPRWMRVRAMRTSHRINASQIFAGKLEVANVTACM